MAARREDMPGDDKAARRGAKRRATAGKAAADGAGRRQRDALGKLIEGHGTTLAGVIVVSLLVAVVGAAIAGWGVFRQPGSPAAMVVGGCVVFLSLALFGVNVMNVGRRFEVRKKGIRYVERGRATEFLWGEIVDVAVDRLDDTYVGVANVRRRSDDVHSSSGLLTKTEWTVIIRAGDGRQIRLSPIFMRTVTDAKGLIGNLRLRAGLRG